MLTTISLERRAVSLPIITMKQIAHYLAYYGSILLPLLVFFALFLLVPRSHDHDLPLTVSKIFWFASALFVGANALGLLYGSPWHREHSARNAWRGWDGRFELVVAYVSRGQNKTALARAIAATRQILDGLGVNYTIEAITDMPVDAGADVSFVVPASYQTRKGARYKARALHYAAQYRRAARNTWVLHMDEESVITPELVHGLQAFLPTARPLTIGQGEIKYNAHNYGSNLLITAIDSIRTGDDLGRFRLQYKLFNRPLFGMHGSFFLVNSLLERKVGFDLGGKGSITEDAYFALVCADRGVRFEWVDGFIREQSPFTIMELLKQRRRWITGLRLLMFDDAVRLKHRAMLMASISLTHVSWISLVVTIWNVAAGGSAFPSWLVFIAAAMTALTAAMYLLGAYRNVIGTDLTPQRRLAIWALSGVFMPISCLVEGLAVIYSIVRPVKVFEVVNK